MYTFTICKYINSPMTPSGCRQTCIDQVNNKKNNNNYCENGENGQM